MAELNFPLSAHEKMEMHLSMPREFWPKTWLDEEGAVEQIKEFNPGCACDELGIVTPPLPHPTGFTCPQCGFGWNESTLVCPRCGANLPPRARPRGTSCARLFYLSSFMICGILSAVCLFFGVLPGGGVFFWFGLVFLASTVFLVRQFISCS